MLIDLGNIKKYGVYVVFAFGLIYNFLVLVVQPAWLAGADATLGTVDTILGFLGLGSFRAKLADLFAGIDLGDVGTWINGNRTYITAVIGAIVAILTAFFPGALASNWYSFVEAILAGLGITFTSFATVNYQKKAMRVNPVATSVFKKEA